MMNLLCFSTQLMFRGVETTYRLFPTAVAPYPEFSDHTLRRCKEWGRVDLDLAATSWGGPECYTVLSEGVAYVFSNLYRETIRIVTSTASSAHQLTQSVADLILEIGVPLQQYRVLASPSGMLLYSTCTDSG